MDGQVNDTDSEKQRRDLEEDEEEEEGQEDEGGRGVREGEMKKGGEKG